ncbi:TolC family protein [Danxiaibacter flavus]|uniref:TolC family protein n=1 Tax=Danxiaibacter flavus TaxID=3049108 RepID=A0ABV3ZFV5_9BACT|nr:TolC family protein [Chitinophagaceae bacterium DXS]
MFKKFFFYSLLLFAAGLKTTVVCSQQALSLKEAIDIAVKNYGTIRAKSNYVKASEQSVIQSQKEYLPDLNVSFQQDYGTVNGQTGPSYGYRGLSVASSGPSLASQNWNSAFGALYLANVNWDFFAFGKAKEKIKVAQTVLARDVNDLGQEKFQHTIRVSAAYLTVLAAHQVSRSQQNNLDRATALRNVVVARVKNGLNAGVDSSLANAEVSNAKISLTRAKDYEQEQMNQLAQLMGVPATDFLLDTLYVTQIPPGILDTTQGDQQNHPLLKFYRERINLSNEQAKYYNTFKYPTFSVFGVMQGKGSGFDYDYGALNKGGFTHSYFDGVNPTRSNYILGVGMIWNLTSPLRVNRQVEALKYTSKGLQDEYDQVNQNLHNQLELSDVKIKNALSNYREAPIQVKSAADAYLQKSVLYKNGLSNIVDVTQALYGLNRAETDRDIAFANVWQALLLKAAASGDFSTVLNGLR